jgi:hypothetical protein
MISTARETAGLRDSTELTKGPKIIGVTDKKGSSSRATGLKRLTSSKNVKLNSNMGEIKAKSYSSVMLEKEDQILAMLKEYKSHRCMTTETGETITGPEVTERMFKLIAAEEGQLDAVNVKSLRLTKKRFKQYLTKLYS